MSSAAPRIVVLGSSTAAGTGASIPDSAWVNLYRAHLLTLDPGAEVVNLAVGGYTTYHVMPTGFSPPVGRPAPDPAHNITHALGQAPDAIIINLPTNDVANGYTVPEQLSNYDRLRSDAVLESVPVWIGTSQPRNLSEALRLRLVEMKDSILSRYDGGAVNLWTGLAAADGTILPQYNAGDGIHLNDAGHRTIFLRMVDAKIWERLTVGVAPGPAHGGEADLRLASANPCRGTARLRLRLAEPSSVRVGVCDLAGREVALLFAGSLPVGEHEVTWKASRAPAGLYFVRMDAGGAIRLRKIVLTR